MYIYICISILFLLPVFSLYIYIYIYNDDKPGVSRVGGEGTNIYINIQIKKKKRRHWELNHIASLDSS